MPAEQTDNDPETKIRKLKAQLAAAQARIAYLEAGLDVVPVGVVLADTQGRIFYGNERVSQIVGHPVLFSESVGSYNEWVSFHPDGRQVESSEYPLSRVLLDGETNPSLNVHYQRGDGTRRWVRIIGQPVRDDSGELIGASVALIDIDSEHQMLATQQVLIGELNHRVKNAFSVGLSVVSQSLKRANVELSIRRSIEDRLMAFSAAHAVLLGGTFDNTPMEGLVAQVVEKVAPKRVTASGDPVTLPSKVALAFSMAYYELVTNAMKHGALTSPDGRVNLTWRIDRSAEHPQLVVDWRERGGPLVVAPDKKGFGSFILDRAIALETGGTVSLYYGEEGFEWRLVMPLTAEMVLQG